MPALAVHTDGGWRTCGPDCWDAAGSACECCCLGAWHQIGSEEAQRRIAAGDVGFTAFVAQPDLFGARQPLPSGAEGGALPPKRGREAAREPRCQGCGRTESECGGWYVQNDRGNFCGETACERKALAWDEGPKPAPAQPRPRATSRAPARRTTEARKARKRAGRKR
jgi:hypothetical protein